MPKFCIESFQVFLSQEISNNEILIFFSTLLYSYMEQLGTNW